MTKKYFNIKIAVKLKFDFSFSIRNKLNNNKLMINIA